jgi:hypothetical protein
LPVARSGADDSTVRGADHVFLVCHLVVLRADFADRQGAGGIDLPDDAFDFLTSFPPGANNDGLAGFEDGGVEVHLGFPEESHVRRMARPKN